MEGKGTTPNDHMGVAPDMASTSTSVASPSSPSPSPYNREGWESPTTIYDLNEYTLRDVFGFLENIHDLKVARSVCPWWRDVGTPFFQKKLKGQEIVFNRAKETFEARRRAIRMALNPHSEEEEAAYENLEGYYSELTMNKATTAEYSRLPEYLKYLEESRKLFEDIKENPPFPVVSYPNVRLLNLDLCDSVSQRFLETFGHTIETFRFSISPSPFSRSTLIKLLSDQCPNISKLFLSNLPKSLMSAGLLEGQPLLTTGIRELWLGYGLDVTAPFFEDMVKICPKLESFRFYTGNSQYAHVLAPLLKITGMDAARIQQLKRLDISFDHWSRRMWQAESSGVIQLLEATSSLLKLQFLKWESIYLSDNLDGERLHCFLESQSSTLEELHLNVSIKERGQVRFPTCMPKLKVLGFALLKFDGDLDELSPIDFLAQFPLLHTLAIGSIYGPYSQAFFGSTTAAPHLKIKTLCLKPRGINDNVMSNIPRLFASVKRLDIKHEWGSSPAAFPLLYNYWPNLESLNIDINVHSGFDLESFVTGFDHGQLAQIRGGVDPMELVPLNPSITNLQNLKSLTIMAIVTFSSKITNLSFIHSLEKLKSLKHVKINKHNVEASNEEKEGLAKKLDLFWWKHEEGKKYDYWFRLEPHPSRLDLLQPHQ